MELTQTEQQKEKKQANKLIEVNLGPIGQHQTEEYLHKMVPESKKRKKGIANIFEEKMAKNFPNLGKEKDMSPESSVFQNKTKPNQQTPKN